MARLVSLFQFTGKLDDFSAYKMRGSDKVIIRRKGGPSKKKIKTSPDFEPVRQNNREFGGRAKASAWIISSLKPLKLMADYNVAGPINALLKSVQQLDDRSRGKRFVLLSKNRSLLEGFSLNRGVTLDAMLQAPITCELSRETVSAKIHLPQLIHGVNFHPPAQHQWYSFVATIGIIPDYICDDEGYHPVHKWYGTPHAQKPSAEMKDLAQTPWHAVMKGGEATTLEVKCKATPPDENFSVMVSVGLAFGKAISESEIMQVKHAGSGKVIRVG